MFSGPEEVAIGLRSAGYATDPVLVQIIWLATEMQKPILIEGPPGTGKTATLEIGITRLSVSMDLTSLKPGAYLIGVRTALSDWMFTPVTIR